MRSAAQPAVCSAMASFDKAAMADKLAKVNSSQGSIESTCVCARAPRARASERPPAKAAALTWRAKLTRAREAEWGGSMLVLPRGSTAGAR